jgi:hypothetical protein
MHGKPVLWRLPLHYTTARFNLAYGLQHQLELYQLLVVIQQHNH